MTTPFFRTLTALAQAPAADGELLRRFADTGDGPTFELLVRRHAEMVWAVCRAAHPSDTHAAEDAFQATFLALARRAGTVRGASAAGWLFRVARNAARRARPGRRPGPLPDGLPGSDLSGGGVEAAEVAAVVAEEVGQLADKFREPVLLCFYEGCTHAEAARRLGLSVGTVASRVARAKDRLHARLTRRGVALPAAGVAGLVAPPPASALLVRAGIAVALGPADAVPLGIQFLTQGVLAAMTSWKPKLIAAVVAGLCLTAGGGTVVVLAGGQGDGPPGKGPPAVVPPTAKPQAAANPEMEKELKALAGEWRQTGTINGAGREEDRLGTEGELLTVKGVDLTFSVSRLTVVGKCRIERIDPEAVPKAVDLKVVAVGTEPSRGKILRCIYELKGDTFVLCLPGKPDAPRPTRFETAHDTDTSAMVFKRKGSPAELMTELDGVWAVTHMEAHGPSASKEGLRALRCVISNGIVWMIHCGEGGRDLKYSIAVSGDAARANIDMTPLGGRPETQGRTQHGLCRLHGDELTVCWYYDLKGDKGRPSVIQGGDGYALVKLKRVRFDTPAPLPPPRDLTPPGQ